MPNADRFEISLSTRSPTEMQVKLPFSDRYSARLSAISLPLEPGGLTSTIRLTKSNAEVKTKLSEIVITFRRLKLLDHVLDGVCGLVGDQ